MKLSAVLPRLLKVNIPDVATKILKARRCNDQRIFTVSSNWLPLFGFHSDAQVVEEVIGTGKGFQVRLADENDTKTKKVYMREYSSRSANPLKADARRIEQLIETKSQRLIQDAMGDAEHAHITFRYGVITFTPITAVERKLLQDLSKDDMINTLVAMTGGVDCSVLEQGGFRVDTVVEYRPQEKRDSTDYTEMTALSTLVSSKPRVLCNEDIYMLDPRRLAELVGSTPISVGHFSIQCDDFSTLKTNQQKKNSINEMASTIDMFIPVLGVIDALKIPVVVVENVPGFQDSMAGDIFTLQLRRRGYRVEQQVFDARDYGGYTSRQRMYMVATTLSSPFSFPEPCERATELWNNVIVPHWDEIRAMEIIDSKVMQDAVTTGRLRVITREKTFAPTLTKAQGQDTKDAVVISHEDRFYRLPVSVQKALNCIPESFDADWMPKDKAAQVIGQSICGKLHHAIMESVSKHIRYVVESLTQPRQLALFN